MEFVIKIVCDSYVLICWCVGFQVADRFMSFTFHVASLSMRAFSSSLLVDVSIDFPVADRSICHLFLWPIIRYLM